MRDRPATACPIGAWSQNSPLATPRSPPGTRPSRSSRSPLFPSEGLQRDTSRRPASSTRKDPSCLLHQPYIYPRSGEVEGGGQTVGGGAWQGGGTTFLAWKEVHRRSNSGTQVLRLGASSGDHRALLFSPCESTGRPRVKLHRSTHSSSSSRDSAHPPAHPPGAHLEAVGLDQVARAQNAVQAGQEPHRPRAEGPVFLRKGRGVQASVCRAVVRQRLQGERGRRASDKKRGHKPTEVSARVCRCVEKSRPQT